MKRLLAILLAALILIPNQVILAQPEPVLNHLNSTRDVAQKLSADVLATRSRAGTHDYLVQFHSSLDLERLPVPRQLLDQGMSQKQAMGVTAVQALQSEARSVQQPFVRQMESAGIDYESFYIANMMWIRADFQRIEQLAYDPAVRAVYLDKTIHLNDTVSEAAPLAAEAPVEWNVRQIGADEVWRDGITGAGVVVGVIDSGVDWSHPALQSKWRAYDPANPARPMADEVTYSWFDAIEGQALPYDDNDHGTHCTGTILGQEANGANTVGVAPGAQWIAAKVFDRTGGASSRVMLRAGEWMLAPGGDAARAPDVINNSWGSGAGIDDWYRDIVRAWRSAGIVPVFAAGNQGPFDPAPTPGTIENPSNYPESFAVAAVDRNNRLGSFSKLGPSPYDPSRIKPDIAGPGLEVRSSVAGGGYSVMDGTSMAAPHIAGVAALMLSANGNLSVDDVLDAIMKTADPLTDARYPKAPNMGYGHGLVNAREAVEYVSGGLGTLAGTVLAAGTDVGEPEVTLTPGPEFAFMDQDFIVEAHAADDVSVVRAELLYRWAGDEDFTAADMKLTEGDEKDGTYLGYIAKAPFFSQVTGVESDGLREGEMTYKVRITDFAGNVTETAEAKAMLSFGLVRDQWKEEFQGDLDGWYLLGDWNVGRPGPYEVQPLIGERVAGTRVGEMTYSELTDSYLITPPIDLRDASVSEATLKFRHYYEMATNSTVARVMITDNNGEDWFDLTPDYYTGQSGDWQADSVDLSAYVGTQVPVYLSFTMVSGGYVDGTGWYLNQVELEGRDVTAPVPPTEVKAMQEIEGLNITWKGSYDGDTVNYEVFRQEGTGEFTYLAETAATAWLDETVAPGVEYNYKVRALDQAGNVGEFSESAAGSKLNYETLLFSDFEADNGGFTTELVPLTNGREAVNSWEWGPVVKYGPERAWSGDNLWATILAGDYLDDSSSRLITPEVTLPDGDGTIVLNFRHWYDGEKYWSFESASDYGMLEVSVDGGATYEAVPGAKWAGHLMQWEKGLFDLSAYKGQTVKVAFRFVTDKWSFGSETFMGWYVDDIGLYQITDPGFALDAQTQPNSPGSAPLPVETAGLAAPGRLSELIQSPAAALPGTSSQAPITAVPVREGRVEILGSGISAAVSPATGSYFLRYPATEGATLRASAYGYYPESRPFSLAEEGHTTAHFVLKKIPRTQVSGTITDAITGDPVADARVHLLEDGRIAPVMTDASGAFRLEEIFAGAYTLEVYHPDYEITTRSVTADTDAPAAADVAMQPFVPYASELAFDDGGAEDAVNMSRPGYGYGMVFDPAEHAHVNAIRAWFWGEDFPMPGGTQMQLALFEVTDQLIPVDELLTELIPVTVERGAWNTFDLSELNIHRDRPFMAAFLQTESGDYSPAIGVDYGSDTGNALSYSYANGNFTALPSIGFQGGWMIRAIVDYSQDAPQITAVDGAREHQGVHYTDLERVTLQGTLSGPGRLEVHRNGELYDTFPADGTPFSAGLRLEPGINTVKTRAQADGRYTAFSAGVEIVRDQILPRILLTEPSDPVVTSRVLDLAGRLDEDYPDTFTVNGETIPLAPDGSFHHAIILKEGLNDLQLRAVDLAGNTAVHPLQVDCRPAYGEPAVLDVSPAADVLLYPGESVTLRLSTDLVGADAVWSLPGGPAGEMTEVAAGVYEALWSAPEGMTFGPAPAQLHVVRGSQRLTAATPGSVSVREAGIRRIAGADRYETAAQTSAFAFTRSESAILTSGESFADAMVGGILAGSREVPVLLTRRSELPEATVRELERLNVSKITIIGGEMAVSAGVEERLTRAGWHVERIAGANRYVTAAQVAQTVQPKADTVYLASGQNYADAMSFAPLAAQMGSALLLTGTDRLSEGARLALAEMEASHVVILGGEAAVGASVERELQALELTTERIYGKDRYATNLAITERYGDPDARAVVIASGETFADALASAGFAARSRQGLMLVRAGEVPAQTLNSLESLPLKEITVLGGTLRITEAVYHQLEQILN